MLILNFYLERTAAMFVEQAERAVSRVLKMATVCVFFITLSGCSPLTVLNVLTPQEADAKTIPSLSYGPLQRQSLDIYTPSNAINPAPVVVFFYGGEWRRGSKKDYAFVGETLAARGIVTVIADYRLYPEVRYPEFLVDSSLAVAWVYREIEKYGGNPEQLFLMGHSAGAYNAAMVALDERWLGMHGLTPEIMQGWIGLAGPYNFLPIENPNVQPVFFHPYTPPGSQPINHVDPSSPPALLIAAEEDKVVNPVRNTEELAEALRNHNVSVETFYFDEVGHATLVATLSPLLNHLAPTLELIEKFVKSHGTPSLTTSPSPELTESNSVSGQ